MLKHVIAIEGNGQRPSHKGDGYSDCGIMYTLNSVEQHSIAYGISSYTSNAMLSDNPHSGIYIADKTRALDLNGGNPSCNQGGVLIVQGVDGQNGLLTGDKSCTLLAQHNDYKNVPSIITEKIE